MSMRLSMIWVRVYRWLGSKWFWRTIVGVFLLETLWLVFSAQYPMAFDENYHFGLIQLHARQWLPFFTAQPAHTELYGAIVRDPSYLFHWLLSLPYRFIALFTDSQTVQIILLRLINVVMFTTGLILFRRLLRNLGTSHAITHVSLAIFILVPVVPFLAAHINYDNLLFALIPLTALLAMRVYAGFRRKQIDARALIELCVVLLVGCLVKYPFLPVVIAVVLWLGWKVRRTGLLNREGWDSFWSSFHHLSVVIRIVLIMSFVLSAGLFAERYVGNLVSYHNPVPSCNAVLSKEACMQYGPFGRDVRYAASKPDTFHPHIYSYAWQWLYGMWYRLFFAINYDYVTMQPLIVISWLAVVLAVSSLVVIALRFKQLFFGQPGRQLLLWITLAYLVILFINGFSGYSKTGQPVAINGRYLIPFMPIMFAFAGLAWSSLLGHKVALKIALASVVIIIFMLQGGGAMTYIVRSNDTWLWNNSLVRSANRVVRNVATPLIIAKNRW